MSERRTKKKSGSEGRQSEFLDAAFSSMLICRVHISSVRANKRTKVGPKPVCSNPKKHIKPKLKDAIRKRRKEIWQANRKCYFPFLFLIHFSIPFKESYLFLCRRDHTAETCITTVTRAEYCLKEVISNGEWATPTLITSREVVLPVCNINIPGIWWILEPNQLHGLLK